MTEYVKIPNIFKRETFGKNKLIDGKYSSPELEYLKDAKWEFTEKIDGCLRSSTKLKLADGTDITIREVVEKKLPVEIMGYDGKNIVPTKVVGWHMNGETDEWYCIKFDRRGLGTKGGSYYRTVCCTGNHKFFIDGEYKRADEIKVGDKLIFNRDNQSLTYQQEQILTGLMIGDGSVADEGRSVEFSQKSDHEGYVDWLLESLGSIAGNKQKARTSGYGTTMIPARTISCTQVENFTSWFTENGKKTIPEDVELSPISLAVMYMDDGSLSKNDGQLDRCTLWLSDYDEHSVDNLVNAFEVQLHLHPVKCFSHGWNLRFNTVDADGLQMLIAPYICGCMQYKLSERYQGMFVGTLPSGVFETVNKTYEVNVLGVEKRTEVHKRYDLTTETHNYFANGVLVHNCNIRICWDGYRVSFMGRTDKAQIPAHLLAKLEELFGGESKEELFEQTFGKKNVILFGEGYGEKIQKGGGLYGSVNFRLFDVLVDGYWLLQDNVDCIAEIFEIETAPFMFRGTLEQGVQFIKTHPKSLLRDAEMEGIVGRPMVQMFSRTGERIMVKIKCRDF